MRAQLDSRETVIKRAQLSPCMEWVRLLGCHRLPDRCLIILGKPMPLCARCFGSCIGHLSAIGLALVGHVAPWWLAVPLVLVMLVDWGIQEFAGILSTNTRRVLTGIAGGFGVNTLLIMGTLAVARTVLGR